MCSEACVRTILMLNCPKVCSSHHGIPNILVADNMPFNSKAFKQFTKEWDFTVVISICLMARS